MPSLERHIGVLLGELRCLRLRFLAITIVSAVEIRYRAGLAERFDEKRVVGPAGTGNLEEPYAEFREKLPSIQGRPDGRVMNQQVVDIPLGNGEGLALRANPPLVAAIEPAFVGRVGVDDACANRAFSRCRWVRGRSRQSGSCRRTSSARSSRPAPKWRPIRLARRRFRSCKRFRSPHWACR